MKTLTTHNGVFHSDEVTAVALLQIFSRDTYSITRTRDAAVIAASDIAIDVGGIYCPDDGRFDHHQTNYNGELSSAGMIWKFLNISGYPEISQLIREIDAQDTGVKLQETAHYCNIISSFNADDINDESQNSAFNDAVSFAVRYLQNIVRKSDLLFEQLTTAFMAEIQEIKGIEIAVTPEGAIWSPVTNFIGISDLVAQYDATQKVWTVQTVPLKKGSFETKYSLEATNRDSEVFCHKAGFITKVRPIPYGICVDGADGFTDSVIVSVKDVGQIIISVGEVYYR